jgi:hypothetical protein
MSAAITLISANEVVNGGIVRPVPLNSRFDGQLLAPNIPVAEERILIPVLCRAFYDDLIAQKTTDESNYNPDIGAIVPKFAANADYEFLWKNYLQEVTARAVFMMSLDDITLQTGSNGLFINSSQFAESAGIEGMKVKEDRALEKLNLATQRMLAYLCKNKDLFSLWPYDKFCKDCGCSCSDTCGCEEGELTPKKNDSNINGVIFY